MTEPEKSIKKLTVWAVTASLCLPVGIVCIVLGAVNGIWAVLGVGIAMTVFGFYGTPLLWVGRAGKRTMKRLVTAVEEENLYETREIAAMLGVRTKEVDAKIKEALRKRYLVGYLYEDGKLRLNTNEKQVRATTTVKCEACGAKVVIDPQDKENRCPYCGTPYGNDAKKENNRE